MRANEIAAAHIAQGSSVTYRSQSVRRSVPSAAAVWRIATISACAVGSRSANVRLPACAMRSPSCTMTQPIGTSPVAAAAWASSSARSMKVCVGMARRGSLTLLSRRDHSREPNERANERTNQPTGAGRTHRQGDGARGPCLAPRGGGVDRRRARRRQRRGDRLARAQRDRTGSHHGRRRAAARARAHAAFPLPQARGPGDEPRRSGRTARPSSRPCRPDCRAWSASGGSISTPKGCFCSPTMAGSRASSNCRRPAGCGVTGCGRSAACCSPRSTGCATASPSTASATARSRPRWTASRAATSGSPLPCARARTARSRTCSVTSASR